MGGFGFPEARKIALRRGFVAPLLDESKVRYPYAIKLLGNAMQRTALSYDSKFQSRQKKLVKSIETSMQLRHSATRKMSESVRIGCYVILEDRDYSETRVTVARIRSALVDATPRSGDPAQGSTGYTYSGLALDIETCCTTGLR